MAAPTTRTICGGEILFYRDSAGTPGTPTWDIIANCGDFNIEDASTELKIGLKGNWPDFAYMRGGNTKGFTFKMLHKLGTTDADFVAFQAAWRNRTCLYLAVSDIAIATEGAQWLKMYCEVMSFNRADPFDAESAYDVVCRPAINNVVSGTAYPPTYGITPGS